MIPRALKSLTVAAFVFASSFAMAQPTVEQAKMLFNAGAQAYTKGNFRGAIQAFEEAYKLAPRPAILFSMAQAYRRQYALDQQPADLRQAIHLYRDYVEQVKEGGRRGDAAQALLDLEPLAARLASTEPTEAAPSPKEKAETRISVSSQVQGAMVSIDGGKPAELPLMVEIKPGRHTVRVFADGYIEQQLPVEAALGAVLPVQIDLVEQPAKVILANVPDSAQVAVDGRPMGVTPLVAPLELSSGTHLITVSKNGYKAFAEEVDLQRGQHKTVQVNLGSSAQRIVAYGLLAGAAGSAVFGIVSTVFVAYNQGQAEAVLDQKAQGNITRAQLDDYNASLAARDDWRRIGAVGIGATLAFGITGLLLYSFDQPTIDARPAPHRDKPSSPKPTSPATMVEVAAAPAWSPGFVGASLGGRF